MTPLRDKIVARVERVPGKGWIVQTQSGRVYGPFASEYEMARAPEIGQRAKNWLGAQGGRTTPRVGGGMC